MAHIRKIIYPKSKKEVWMVQLRKENEKVPEGKKYIWYSETFPTEEEARNFADDNEHIFYLFNPGDKEYERAFLPPHLRRFRHKIKEMEENT